MLRYPHLFSPFKIGNVTIKNRIVKSPMATNYGSVTGEVTDQIIDYYVETAKGGVGLIIVENTTVDYPQGKDIPCEMSLDEDRFISGHNDLVEAIHEAGAKAAVQLHHAGRQTTLAITGGLEPVAASPVPCVFLHEIPFPVPRELTVEEIHQIMDKFAAATDRAKAAGYDMIELHGAHGYLFSTFMSPYMNKRGDEFGGSLENRMRFTLGVIARIKEAVGPDYPIGIRFCGDEYLDGGITVEESPRIAKMLEDSGVAVLHVSAGVYETLDLSNDSMYCQQGWKRYILEAIRPAVKAPIIAAGGFKDPDFVDKLIGEGLTDFVGLGRPLVADPEWPNKAREGREDEIRKCISCNECLDKIFNVGMRCAVNATPGREKRFAQLVPAAVKKRVMVIGGGPAGMEAARTAAMRGHGVTLFEKSDRLGGQLHIAAIPPAKDKLNWLTEYLTGEMKRRGVKVQLGIEVDAKVVEQTKPDVVIVATGARPASHQLPPGNGHKVADAWDVLTGKVEIKGAKVVVLGGRMTGCETAEFLAERGNTVTIVARSSQIAPNVELLNRAGLLKELRKKNVGMLTGHDIVGFTGSGIELVDKRDGRKKPLEADWVVVARGVECCGDLCATLEGKVGELYTIGDAKETRKIMDAVYEGALVGRQI